MIYRYASNFISDRFFHLLDNPMKKKSFLLQSPCGPYFGPKHHVNDDAIQTLHYNILSKKEFEKTETIYRIKFSDLYTRSIH